MACFLIMKPKFAVDTISNYNVIVCKSMTYLPPARTKARSSEIQNAIHVIHIFCRWYKITSKSIKQLNN